MNKNFRINKFYFIFVRNRFFLENFFVKVLSNSMNLSKLIKNKIIRFSLNFKESGIKTEIIIEIIEMIQIDFHRNNKLFLIFCENEMVLFNYFRLSFLNHTLNKLIMKLSNKFRHHLIDIINLLKTLKIVSKKTRLNLRSG